MPIAHHVSHEHEPWDRGHGFGAAHAPAVAVTVDRYRRLLDAAAGVDGAAMRTAGAALAETLPPDLVDELAGLAEGAGQDVRDLLAINARTELLAGAARPECSVVGRAQGGAVTLAQTWDWHPDLAPARVAWTVHRPGGGWFTTVTEAGILAKLGLNSHGVACALNYLSCSADGGVRGVPIHVLLRFVLEHATDAESAAGLLREARTSASSAVTIAGPGALRCVELSPGGAVVLTPDADGWLVHTNHFLAPPPRGADQGLDDGPGSALRLARVTELVRSGATPHEALACHDPEIDPVCRHPERDADAPWPDRLATLLTTRIDPGAPSFALADGPPCRTPFTELPLPADTPARLNV